MNYELRNLTIGYGKKVIATNINATLEGGKLTCLLGPNGAGKSTLLRTLCAFQEALSGDLYIQGNRCKEPTPIHTINRQELSQTLGVVLTERVAVAGMTVRDIIAMGRSPYTGFWGTLSKEDERIVEDAIRECGIEPLTDCDSTTLSDGERQKVMIAKTLAQQTPIILLDEPTAFLDFPSKVETMLLLQRLAHEQGKAILISTHDLDLALQTADCLWLMGKDEQMQIGSPRQLADEDSLRRFFSNPNVAFDAQALRFTVQQATDSKYKDHDEAK